jgi:hypothetical protein
VHDVDLLQRHERVKAEGDALEHRGGRVGHGHLVGFLLLLLGGPVADPRLVGVGDERGHHERGDEAAGV